MAEEKIKFYIPQEVLDVLEKDMELMELERTGGEKNRSGFLNRLIVNYTEEYQSEMSKVYDEISKKILSVTGDTDAELASELLDVYVHGKKTEKRDKPMVSVFFRPANKTQSTIDYIQEELLRNNTFSGFLRDMITSYASLPMFMRERIIFKERYEAIAKAIKKKKKLMIATVRHPDETLLVHPVALEPSGNEMFHYLVAVINDENGSERVACFRMSRLAKIQVSTKPMEISETAREHAERTVLYGSQNPINNDEEIAVRMTDEGRRRYKAIYINRPPAVREEGDVFYFQCSTYQCKSYFERFGKHAVVLSPPELAEAMKQYYEEANEEYQKAN